ncbi:hypothetical protein L9F63_016705, partial [Diploptera punctata]
RVLGPMTGACVEQLTTSKFFRFFSGTNMKFSTARWFIFENRFTLKTEHDFIFLYGH